MTRVWRITFHSRWNQEESNGAGERKNCGENSIGIVKGMTAEVAGLHVELCETVFWHCHLNASQGLLPATAVQQGCSCAGAVKKYLNVCR